MIKIETVLDILKKDDLFREIIDQGHYHYYFNDVTFDSICYDSRKANDNSLFFVKGAAFKKEFLLSAISQGLGWYVAEQDYEVGIPVIVVSDIKKAMSLIAMEFYGNPQEKLKLLAFTGTKGKTTAAYFAYNILNQQHRPAMLSTMNTTLDGKTFFKSALTTPESIDLFDMMAQAVDNGRSHLIMEVSSQAYLVKRVYGLTFDVGVFLNISPDHIGPIEHPTFEDYFYHKRLLLENSRVVIINSGMNHFAFVAEEVADKEHDFYGKNSDNAVKHGSGFSFKASGKLAGDYDIQLIGDFNQDNAMAAGLACLRLGASLQDIKEGIAQTSVPGRMEVLTQTKGAKVFVDYAHNGDSLDKLLQVVTSHQDGHISLILGAPGNKGESRRKDFGHVLNTYLDVDVFLTADDPNKEDPLAICQEIASHINREVRIIVDREEAIKTAMSETTASKDAVVIAGKGADAFQIVNGKRDNYAGDIEVAKKYL